MISLGNLMTYSYNEMPGLKHGACILITATLVLEFFGGFWSGILGWWWMVLSVVWVCLKIWSYITYDNIGAKYEGEHTLARIIITAVPTLIFLIVYLVGYYSGPRGWWWPCLFLSFFYLGLSKIIQKARKGH